MTIENAIRKAERITGNTIIKKGQFFTANYKGFEIEFAKNGASDEATNFYTRKETWKDDLSTDYFAGVFHDNLTQCFNFINSY